MTREGRGADGRRGVVENPFALWIGRRFVRSSRGPYSAPYSRDCREASRGATFKRGGGGWGQKIVGAEMQKQ